MNLRLSVEWIFLFFVSCFSLSFIGLSTIEAASSACLRTHPGYDKCREINADCFDLGNRSSKCQCSQGYWMFEGRCQKADWCSEGEIGDVICKSNGTICRSLEWTTESYTELPFKCDCESKYTQSGICSVNELYCQQRGARSYRHENITLCTCENNQFFDYGMSRCQDLDVCPFKKCKGKYEECQGGECVCKTNYWREGNACRPKDFCDAIKCGKARCQEGPEDDPKNVRCYCDSGYVLMRKDGELECQSVRCESHSLNPCDHICRYSNDTKTTFCECLEGHTLKSDNTTCEIQASYKCNYNICDSRSVCIKIDGEQICKCKNGLVAEEGKCLDRCSAGKLLPHTCPGACKSIEGGFQCVCEGKYRQSKDKVTCEERQMCLEGEEGFRNCSENNRTCEESPETEEGFKCQGCMDGFQEYEGNCVDLCEVQENKRFCAERGGTCITVNGRPNEIECKCPPLFAWKKTVGCVFAQHSYTGILRMFNSYEENPQNDLTDTLPYGEGDLDWEKLDNDIRKSMLALFGPALCGVNVNHCRRDQIVPNKESCIVCAVELQLHFEDYGILQRLTSYTVCRGRGLIDPVFCFIPPYLKLVPREEDRNTEEPFHKTNVCGPVYGLSVCPFSTNCVPEDTGFSCRCKEGFTAKSAMFLNNDKTGIIEMCQDINECETRSPCPKGSICRNTIGDFECPCEPGLFRWNSSGNPKWEECTRACDEVNCINGKCEDHNNGFYCSCNPGYRGPHCEDIIPDYQRQGGSDTTKTTVIIAVGIVEIIIAIVLVVVIACRFFRKPAKDRRKKDITSVTLPQQGNNTQNRTIENMHMRSTAVEPNGSFRLPFEEEPEEPIYADCTQTA